MIIAVPLLVPVSFAHTRRDQPDHVEKGLN
ncbi:hypothetical protein GA0070607_6438 [Micromonospora coriariae]|uniref:Uncharacterized protein n=1 Tax=Micromonospora coriariae TaxID=285665 RepID=A0A1C4Y8Z0_9ACTN|nr:hypothetical protein GA0070607_6438 [Micromonospora coriariae]